jgi:hypothetical protein
MPPGGGHRTAISQTRACCDEMMSVYYQQLRGQKREAVCKVGDWPQQVSG